MAMGRRGELGLSFDVSSDRRLCERECAELLDAQRSAEWAAGRLLAEHREAARSVARCVHRLRTRLALVESDAQHLCIGLEHASTLAENISDKVRDLDTAKSHVVDCLQRVEDMLDLRLCTEGVTAAMASEEYEQAAQHVHRFLSLDAELFAGAEHTVDGGDVDDAQSLKRSYSVLKAAQKQLQALVLAKFDEAVRADDAASTERFFKLFPLLNQHEVGMERYGTHLCRKVAKAADDNFDALRAATGVAAAAGAGAGADLRSGVVFADALTLLFECVARVVEVHQPLVLAAYGPAHVFAVTKRLHAECDRHAGRILDEFTRERQFQLRAKHATLHRPTSTSAAAVSGTQAAGTGTLEPSVLDALLSEAALMHSRAELYGRFLRRKVAEGERHAKHGDHFDQFYGASALSRRMQELIGHYVGIEQYFMEQCLMKVVAPTPPRAEDAATGSDEMVEDIFFIVRKCIRRALSSGNVDCVCAVVNNAATLLDTQVCASFANTLQSGYPSVGSLAEAYSAAAAAVGSIQSGKMAPPVDGAERARVAFVAALNRSRAAAAGATALRRRLAAEFDEHMADRAESHLDTAKLHNSLEQLADVAAKFATHCCAVGVQALVAGAVKPRLKAAAATFADYDHRPSEEQFADFEVNDPFIEDFIVTFDNVVTAFQPQLYEENYQGVVEQSAAEAGVQLERVVRKCAYNRLGALQVEKEVRQLCNYVSSAAGWSARRRLARLTDVAGALAADSLVDAIDFVTLHAQHDDADADQPAYGHTLRQLRPVDSDLAPLLALRVDLPTQ